MRNRKNHRIGILLLTVILALAWMERPRDFLDVQPMDQAEKFYVWTTSGQFSDTHPQREEMEPLLELLESAKLRPKSRGSRMEWDGNERHFGFSCSRPDGIGWVEVAGFDLYIDDSTGRVYFYHRWWDSIEYQLTDCDMHAIEAELLRLLGRS